MENQTNVDDIEQLLESKGFYSFQNTTVFEEVNFTKWQRAWVGYSLFAYLLQGRCL